ncbi:hypothetical protein PtB15_7B312 [Puccinia triticina]|nr:hypothetical protein PtB15_7B312 [Puccinia triticina]
MSNAPAEQAVSLVSKAKGIENYKILDCSFSDPRSGQSALDEFRQRPKLPGASLFDHEVIADTAYTIDGTTKVGYMQPDSGTFKREMERLGITRNDHLLVYDYDGIIASPRAAWIFNAYGHPKVSVLDGGLPRWIKEECPVETGSPIEPERSEYELPGCDEALARGKVISYDAIVRNFKVTADGERMCVFDARPRGSFLGTGPELWPGLPSGHMPHSLSLPYTSLLTQPSDSEPYSKFLSPDQLEKIFLETLNNDHKKWEQIKHGQEEVVVTCAIGMTACIIWLAIRLCAPTAIYPRIYDESWVGYVLRKDAQILTNRE